LSRQILFDHQEKYLDELPLYEGGRWPRTCLYYRTGAGKTLTSLLAIQAWGHDLVTVIAPPATHDAWQAQGKELDITVMPMSHAKFRMKDTKLSRRMPLIIDEFHLLGGVKGKGFRKMQALARGLEAPLQLLSATPNWNDAERVYCVHSILNPTATKGGYINWLYENCRTEQDPFSQTPKVVAFRDYVDAAHFLAGLPNVWHLPDTRVVDIEDIKYAQKIPDEFYEWGYDRRNHRAVASLMEARHTVRLQGLVNDHGHVHAHVMAEVIEVLGRHDTVLIYCDRATVAKALARTLGKYGIECNLVTGDSTRGQKLSTIDGFRSGDVGILVGTATLATGTDGLDKVCKTLLIVDDTEDDSLRRQLIGRILPRGVEAPIDDRKIYRLVPS
jgi:superfamily II DNA or RNA helicase